jgi:hypothetical protein
MVTDAALQQALRSDIFKNRTIITISQWINTIIDSDRIPMLDKEEWLVSILLQSCSVPEMSFRNWSGPACWRMGHFCNDPIHVGLDYLKVLNRYSPDV